MWNTEQGKKKVLSVSNNIIIVFIISWTTNQMKRRKIKRDLRYFIGFYSIYITFMFEGNLSKMQRKVLLLYANITHTKIWIRKGSLIATRSDDKEFHFCLLRHGVEV